MPASWQQYPRIPTSFPDGMVNTLVIVEKFALCGSGGTVWGHTDGDLYLPVFAAWSMEKFQQKPGAATCNPALASTPFWGLNVALADGSVRPLAPSISEETWWAACTPAGEETMGADW